MARKAGQLISRGPRAWLVRISLGRDPETGTRKYHNKTVRGSFREAQTYLNKVGPRAGREVIPWLAASKYQFIVIDEHNLEVLQANRDIPAYKKFLTYYYPGLYNNGVK